jgi:hypothetical protein
MNNLNSFYKPLDLDRLEDKKESVWSKMYDKLPYQIRNFFFKVKRSFKWAVFMFKMRAWDEDYQLKQVIRQYLLTMSDGFEKYSHSANAKHEVSRMRLAAELINRSMNEYYYEKYRNEANDPELERKKTEVWDKDGWEAAFKIDTYKEGYDYTYIMKGENKDRQAFKIALTIIVQDCDSWWV